MNPHLFGVNYLFVTYSGKYLNVLAYLFLPQYIELAAKNGLHFEILNPPEVPASLLPALAWVQDIEKINFFKVQAREENSLLCS